MVLNLKLDGKSEAALENQAKEENICAPPFSGNVLQSGTNYVGSAYGKEALPIEQTTLSIGNEDVELNITGCTKPSEPLMMNDTCEDATECSSSFGDTGSGTENASAFSDDEVVSQMYANKPFSSMFYQENEPSLIRKKKLTNHWTRFIRPLRWRCKWIELKLKQLRSQELKYEKELAAYDYRRQHVFANFTLDGCDTKSVPQPEGICGEKVMKRKKRRRVEETCNLASYMSDHCVFSYYENKDPASHANLKNVNGRLKNFNGVAEGISAGDLESNEEFKWNDIFSHLDNDLMSSLDNNDSDKSLVNVIEKIEAAQSEVCKLRTRIDKVVSENVGTFSSVDNLNMLVPSNDSNLCDPNSASLAGNKSTFSARNLFVEKTKESVEEKKSVSLAQASEPDLFAENAASNLLSDLKACSASKSNVSGNRRGTRKKSGSNSWSWRYSG